MSTHVVALSLAFLAASAMAASVVNGNNVVMTCGTHPSFEQSYVPQNICPLTIHGAALASGDSVYDNEPPNPITYTVDCTYPSGQSSYGCYYAYSSATNTLTASYGSDSTCPDVNADTFPAPSGGFQGRSLNKPAFLRRAADSRYPYSCPLGAADNSLYQIYGATNYNNYQQEYQYSNPTVTNVPTIYRCGYFDTAGDFYDCYYGSDGGLYPADNFGGNSASCPTTLCDTHALSKKSLPIDHRQVKASDLRKKARLGKAAISA